MNHTKLTVTCTFHVMRYATGLDGKLQPWLVDARGRRFHLLTEDSDPAIVLHDCFAEAGIPITSLVIEPPK